MLFFKRFTRLKQTVSENYDRIAFFAGTCLPGQCFACVLEKQQDSATFFISKKDTSPLPVICLLLRNQIVLPLILIIRYCQ